LQTGQGASLLWAAGVDTFVLSLVLVYLREKTGALYAGMLVHSLNNLIAFGVHFHGLIF
jgi:membrane protease YdiL (CAAX protease family)